MNIKLKIINNHNLSEKEVREEVLLAETRMNSGSKLRFHIEEVTPIVDNNNASKKIPDSDIKYFGESKIC